MEEGEFWRCLKPARDGAYANARDGKKRKVEEQRGKHWKEKSNVELEE